MIKYLKVKLQKHKAFRIMIEKNSDEFFIEEFRNGKLNSFEALFLKYNSPVFNLSLRMMGNKEEAEDMTQDIFIKAYKNLHNFRGDSSFKTWLYRIATTTCIDGIRKKKSFWNFFRKIIENKSPVTEKSNNYEEKEWIQEVLKSLPPNQRLLLVLRYIQGFSNKEIAGILNCSEGSLKVKLYRARENFKKKAERNLKA